MRHMYRRALASLIIIASAGIGADVGTAVACPGVGVFYTVGCAMHNPPPPRPCTNIACRNDKL